MSWDVDKAVAHLQQFAHQKSTGRCAQYTREAIEAGGVVLARHGSAKDYGPSLIAVGFTEWPGTMIGNYVKGDIGIIHPIPGHPHGHMAMYDGKKWISDFIQWKGLYPGKSYRAHKPSFNIYRYGIMWDGVQQSQGSTAYA